MMIRFLPVAALLALLTACSAGAATSVDSGQIGGGSYVAPPANTVPSPDAACPPGFIQLDGGSCLALPPSAGPETQVAIFLHGTAWTRQIVFAGVAALAENLADAGVALLVPFGTRGLCSWSEDVKELMCWPIAPSHADALQALEHRLDRDLRLVAQRLGATAPTVPAFIGFSNGGFAAARLAAEGSMPMRSLVVIQGGGTPPITFPPDRRVPTLLQAARDDEWHFPTMQRLRQQLQDEAWPATWLERDGPHSLLPEDVEATVRFLAPRQVAADQQ